MMKRFFFVCMAAFLTGSVAMAQEERPERRAFDAEAQAERMTERMARDYALTDEQKEKLLAANREWAEKMKEMPAPPRQRPGRHHHRRSYSHCCGCDVHEHWAERDRPDRAPLTDEQRAELRKEREKKLEEMKAARQAYDEQLRQIMTDDQYSDYQSRRYRDRP